MKKITAIALLLMAVIILSSCQLSEILPPSSETKDSGSSSDSSSSGNGNGNNEILETPIYDYMGTDLTQFVTLCDYKGIKLINKVISVTDSMVDRYIGEMFVAKNKYNKKNDGTLKEFDYVNMSYVGKLDGVAFSGGTANDVLFFITENSEFLYGSSDRTTITPGYKYIPGFANEMIGKDASKPFDINVTFPENYGATELAGKDVVFTITINYILEPVELNETTVKDLDDEMTVDEFKKSVKEMLVSEYKQMGESEMNDDLWDYLLDKCEFKALPEEYVEALYQSELSYIQSIADMYSVDVETILMSYYGISTKEEFRKLGVENSVKQSIITYQILKQEDLDLTDEEYDKRLKEIADAQNTTSAEIEKLYTKEYILDIFRFDIINEYLFSQCAISK